MSKEIELQHIIEKNRSNGLHTLWFTGHGIWKSLKMGGRAKLTDDEINRLQFVGDEVFLPMIVEET